MEDKCHQDNVTLESLAQHVAVLRDEVHEIREMLATLLSHHKWEWTDLPPRPSLFSDDEDRISLEDAVSIFWGKSAAKDAESRGIHADLLKRWAIAGMNGVLLEAETVRGKWYTSRQAVQRFQRKLNTKRREK
jgi:hypothetical protein